MKKINIGITFLLASATGFAMPSQPAAQASAQTQAKVPAPTPAKLVPATTSKQPEAATANNGVAAPANGTVTASKPVYTLRLNSNPTTGYSWFIMSYPAQLVKIVKHQFVPPNSKLMGAGGTSVWQFKATPLALSVPTIIPIKMIYTRPWSLSSDSTAQTFYIITKV